MQNTAMEFLPMRGGDDKNSYFQNSNYQRIATTKVKGKIDEKIIKILDTKKLTSTSKTICVADLGCSTGPNTFIAMQNIIEAIKQKHHTQCPNSKTPEFQVFFNDRTSNDFNTLFKSIPQNREYFPVGVPGSFHNRLFPESSLHLVYSTHALHWLSKLPKKLLDQKSAAWNKGKIYYLNAPREVCNAYASQFYKDVDIFLTARAKEIVQGGMMIILMTGRPNEVQSYCHRSFLSMEIGYMESIFMEMAKEGLINEALVDSFNIPIYASSPEEMSTIVERNGYFEIERIEFLSSTLEGATPNVSVRIKHSKAGLEGMLSKHFGSDITDQMFERLSKIHAQNLELPTSENKGNGQLFIVLKRK